MISMQSTPPVSVERGDCRGLLLEDSPRSLLAVAEEVDVTATLCELPDAVTDELEEVDSETGLSRSQKLIGMICVVIAIFSWLMLSLVGGEVKSPLYARYVVNSSWMSLFVVWLPIVYRKRRKCQRVIEEIDEWTEFKKVTVTLTQTFADAGANTSSLEYHKDAVTKVSNAATLALKHKLTRNEAKLILDKHLTLAGTLQLTRALLPWTIFVGWFGALCGFTWFVSLEHTDFAINNTIYQTTCAVVYLLSVFVLRTSKLTLQKSVSVGLCIGGVALISFTTKRGDNNDTTAMGLLLVIVSMLFYSVMAIAIEYIEPRYYRPLLATEDSLFFTALCGVATFFTFFPVVAFGYYTGFTKVQISLPGSLEFNKILGVAMLDVVFNTVFIFGISYSNALLIVSGVILIVPVSFVLDSVILGKYSPNIWAVLGTVMIVTGFIFIQFPVLKWWRQSRYYPFGGEAQVTEMEELREASSSCSQTDEPQ